MKKRPIIPTSIEPLEFRIAPAGLQTLTLPDLNGLNGFGVKAPGAIDRFSSVGDINGDGIADLAFSTQADNGGRGIVYVVFGKAGGFPAQIDLTALNGTDGFTITGAAAGDNLGKAIGSASDLNGDGVDDLLITATGVDTGGVNAGAAYVIYGHKGAFPPTMSVSNLNGNGFTITGESANGLFGFSTATLGDFNGDGHPDLALGASGAFSGKGAVYLVYGRAGNFPATLAAGSISGTTGLRLIGDFNEHIGFVQGAGDVNGDGVADVSIGQDFADFSISNPHISIIYGDSTVDPATVSGFTIESHANYGIQIGGGASVADINHDGKKDLLVPITYVDAKNRRAYGAEIVVYGTANGFSDDPFVKGLPKKGAGRFIGGESPDTYPGGNFGYGDFNGDGNDDFLFNVNGITTATLVYGGKTLTGYKTLGSSGDAGIKFVGTSDQESFNASAGFSADVNGDGITDILLRVPAAQDGSQITYVAFGGSGKIASNGKSLSYRDWDGDLVTVSVSQGHLDYSMFSFASPAPGTPGAVPGGKQLVELNLASGGSQFEHTAVSITVHKVAGGNGKADVDEIDATGLDLGAIKIAGGLGQIDAGHSPAPGKTTLGVSSLKVSQLGFLSTDFIWATPPSTRTSAIAGGLGALSIAGDFNKAALQVTGQIGSVKIAGNVIGGAVAGQAAIGATATLGAISIGGSIMGADVAHPFMISAGGTVEPTSQAKTLAIKSLTVSGSVENALVLAGFSLDGSPVNQTAGIGSILVKKNWTASSISAGIDSKNAYFGDADDRLINSTPPYANSSSLIAAIASIRINGSVAGTAGGSDHFAFTARKINAVIIGGAKSPLTADDDNLPIGDTGDFVIAENDLP